MVAACELVGTIDAEVPVVHIAGNLAFGVLLVTAIVVEVVLWLCATRPGAPGPTCGGAPAPSAAMAVAFAIWNLAQGPWCDPTSWLQGHAVWHLLVRGRGVPAVPPLRQRAGHGSVAVGSETSGHDRVLALDR